MKRTVDYVRRAARIDCTVLLLGEPGTGKERLAREIHLHSKRRDGPFVTVALAALAEDQVEQALFGALEAGRDGQMVARQGGLAAAGGGTAFIDEIGDLPKTAQARLLRLLENGTLQALGNHRDVRMDVRIIAGTEHDLTRRVEQGTFREDLFYRVNLIPIAVPPLRARPEDIPGLARCFLDEFHSDRDLPALELDAELVEALMRYDWPGNVRQLGHCLERMAAQAEGGTLSVEDLRRAVRDGLPAGAPDGNGHRDRTLAALERKAVLSALDEAGGHRARAAEILGISVRTLQRKLKRWHAKSRPD